MKDAAIIVSTPKTLDFAVECCRQAGLRSTPKKALSTGLDLAIAATSALPSQSVVSGHRPITLADFYDASDAFARVFQSAHNRDDSFQTLFKSPIVSLPHIYSRSVFPFAVSTEGPTELSWMENYLAVQTKLDFYQEVRHSLKSDIAFIQNEYLLDGSAAIVREQQKKLAAVDLVIDEFKTYTAVLGNKDTLYVSAGEREVASLVGATLLELERVHAFSSSLWNDAGIAPAPSLRDLWHAFLRYGRTRRYFVRRLVCDKRTYFRTLVRTLFKQMDDQSGHDESLALFQPTLAKTHFMTQTSFNNAKRSYPQAA